MKTIKIPIPKGWKRIRGGTILNSRDRYLDGITLGWEETGISGAKAENFVYIRKIKPRRKK